jgi:hypothetical protein
MMGESAMTDPFAALREVAEAVLYEGYVLYPYRASSGKNTNRWQFGVLMPPSYVADDESERSSCQTEMIFEAHPEATLRVRVCFLHAQHRTGGDQPDWDEAVERQVGVHLPVAELSSQPREWPFTIDAETHDESGKPRADRRDPHRGDGIARTVRGAAADDSGREPDCRAFSRARRRAAQRARRHAHAGWARARTIPVDDRPTGVGRP